MQQKQFFDTSARINGGFIVDYSTDDRGPIFTVRYVPWGDPDSMFYLETARGDIREFRSLDTLFRFLRSKHVVDFKFMPGPDFFEFQQ